jgi:hypothetical protein
VRAALSPLCPRQERAIQIRARGKSGLSTVPGPCGDAGSAASRSARSAYGCAWRRMAFASRRPPLASRPGEHRVPGTGRRHADQYGGPRLQAEVITKS